MANTRETVTQTYEGESIQCAKIVVNDTADLKLPGICPINDSYIFQLVAKADAARTITVKVGNLTRPRTMSSSHSRTVHTTCTTFSWSGRSTPPDGDQLRRMRKTTRTIR